MNALPEKAKDIIRRTWGFSDLRPLQEQAMLCDLEGKDSLVVMPTGGGKSLCYQAPAVIRGSNRTTVVVSPLIALMKDQVDSLRASGVAATQLDSSLTGEERSKTEMDLAQGQLRMLFLSPERLVSTDIYRILQKIDVRTFAIDEAHCISHWGHDFRPEYRQLQRLRDFFPRASVHAYTATATEQVRHDISTQLGLREPTVLVGNFDRPNLTYRVLARHEELKQVFEVLDRHRGEAGIIYCPRRRSVDELTATLQEKKFSVLPYHAGMTGEQRQERRRRSGPSVWTWSLRRWHSAWALIAPTCVSCCIRRCPSRWNIISKRPAGRVATGWRQSACCCTRAAIFLSNKRLMEKSAAGGRRRPGVSEGRPQTPGRHRPLLPQRRLPPSGTCAVFWPGVCWLVVQRLRPVPR